MRKWKRCTCPVRTEKRTRDPCPQANLWYNINMQTNTIEKYFLFILLLVTIIFAIIIFYPFLTMLVLSAAFAVILNPIYSWIKNKITRNISWLASLLTILIFFLCLCIPLFFIGKSIFFQTQDFYISVINKNSPNQIIESILSQAKK